MIQFLLQRLQAAEEAINTSEQIVKHERDYRKQMSQDLKRKNEDLRKMIDQERVTLSQKI
jgi:hypothetical protein